MKQSELDALQIDDVYPMNQEYLSIEDKLDIAIAMAESLAEMHGYEGGVVTNDDIALGQWLYADDDRVILNDMNDAMFMDWNYRKEEYCKYWRSFGGTYKAPEEYDGDWLDETVDIWPMGNILFSLLTGTFVLLLSFCGMREASAFVGRFFLIALDLLFAFLQDSIHTTILQKKKIFKKRRKSVRAGYVGLSLRRVFSQFRALVPQDHRTSILGTKLVATSKGEWSKP